MIVLEVTEDKFGKAMKAISKITEHAECLHDLFEELAEDSEYGDRYGNRKRYFHIKTYKNTIACGCL